MAKIEIEEALMKDALHTITTLKVRCAALESLLEQVAPATKSSDVRDAISKALRTGSANTGSALVQRDSAEAAQRLSKARSEMFKPTAEDLKKRRVRNPDGSAKGRGF
jgi:uncharacterized protein YaaN involved in tellurite resistance